jgi:hypothetical protein
MTIMVLNKDPQNAAQVTFNLIGIQRLHLRAYTLASTASSAISASSSAAWNATQSFAPYSITLLVINGSEASKPASEWYLNPDDLMIPASGTATLHPAISERRRKRDALLGCLRRVYEGAAACSGGSLTLSNSTITAVTAWKYHRQRGQHSRLLPLYRHRQRRCGHPDAGRMDRCRQSAGHAYTSRATTNRAALERLCRNP